MKKLLLLVALPLLMGCSADDGSVSSEEVTLFVNHYKTTSVLHGTALVVQENEAIGSTEFGSIPHIEGFEFEAEFTYNLRALKTTTKNPGTDASTTSYKLLEVITKEPLEYSPQFRVPLSTFVNGYGYVSWLSRKPDSTFVLSREIPLDCRALCSDLRAGFESRELMTGTFEHGDDGQYVLTELSL